MPVTSPPSIGSIPRGIKSLGVPAFDVGSAPGDAGGRSRARLTWRMQQEPPSDAVALPPPAPRISVVLMAWNEAASVAAVALELHAELVRLGESFELLLIDDGS